MPSGPLEIGLVIFVIVLLFGAKKLPELAGSLGQSIKEFRKATDEAATEDDESATTSEDA